MIHYCQFFASPILTGSGEVKDMISEFLEKNSQKVTYHTEYLKDLKITDNGIVYQDRSLKRFN